MLFIIVGDKLCFIFVYGTADPMIEPFGQFLIVLSQYINNSKIEKLICCHVT